ncbi:MAG: radical SAM protein [Lentisphaeria bacterium]|nr:radical SAM protein [Lentisphaeria bacterium]
MRGLVFDISEGSIHDGPGLRTTVFLKGCPLRCKWCHSPEGQGSAPEILHLPGAGERLCGIEWEAADLARHLAGIAALCGDRGGVTFSGGEPLRQPEFLLEVLAGLRGVHTIVETSGCCDGDVLLKVAARVSRLHYGLKILDGAAAKFWTGRDSRPMLENLRRLDDSGTVEYHLRLPLIAGAVDTPENLRALLELTATLRNCRRIDFLPANQLAPAKYAACGREFAPECRDCRTGTIPEWFVPAVPWSILE